MHTRTQERRAGIQLGHFPRPSLDHVRRASLDHARRGHAH